MLSKQQGTATVCTVQCRVVAHFVNSVFFVQCVLCSVLLNSVCVLRSLNGVRTVPRVVVRSVNGVCTVQCAPCSVLLNSVCVCMCVCVCCTVCYC